MEYIRSIGEKYKVEPSYFKKHDFHIHLPEGAVPKDGPSAGITMATALISAITKMHRLRKVPAQCLPTESPGQLKTER